MQIRLFKPKIHHLSPYVLKMLSRTPFVCVKYLFPHFPCRAWTKYTWFWSKFVHEIWVCPLAALAPLATLWSPAEQPHQTSNYNPFLFTFAQSVFLLKFQLTTALAKLIFTGIIWQTVNYLPKYWKNYFKLFNREKNIMVESWKFI